MSDAGRKFAVGGVRLDRPFRIRRFGHFQFYSRKLAEARKFYIDLLGFTLTDELDLGDRIADPVRRAAVDDTRFYFTRFAGDHHSLILSSLYLDEARGKQLPPRLSIGQISWQVGGLQEVVDGENWFRAEQLAVVKSGRDTPGSNWHSYIADPDGHPNEIFYGMEQIGWNGFSRPPSVYRGSRDPIRLPQISERQEIDDGLARGIDMASGYRPPLSLPADTVMDGVLAQRPFRITGLGPVRVMARDIDASIAFYRDRLGLAVTEEIVWRGHRCIFLRVASEHHSLALYPEAIAAELGLSPHSFCFSLGVRLHNYRHLKNAIGHLRQNDVAIRYLPPELFPGMDYTAFAVDPDGHLVQLYAYMEQLGWSGAPRPPEARLKIDNENWPETIDPHADSFGGEVFLGPLA